MAAMNEAMRLELKDKGEAIILETGQAARFLVKNSDLQQELLKAARYFAAQEPNLQATSHMFKQMNAMAIDLKEKVDSTEKSLKLVPSTYQLFSETESIFSNSATNASNVQ